MNTTQLNETSKFLSYVLRHEPQAIGLQLDNEGWADIESLVAGAAKAGRALDISLIQAVVSSIDKKRFSISDDGLRIRAVQGHSTPSVSLQHIEREPTRVSLPRYRHAFSGVDSAARIDRRLSPPRASVARHTNCYCGWAALWKACGTKN